MVEWTSSTALLHNRCLHELFEDQVVRTPLAVAIVHGHQQITYRDLNQRANQLARHLRHRGVGPETTVAMLVERSIDFVTAILALFKAGGAFLPLDPQHPAQRHFEILEQSRCPYVITTRHYESLLADALMPFGVGWKPQVFHFEPLMQEKEAQENLSSYSKPENLAYVMYTSGSTGLPKGVMVEQAGMVNHIHAKIADLGISMVDRVAQNSPPGFDIVVWQCLAALVVGGTVHIVRDEIANDPLQLLRQTEQQKITVLQVVPSMLRALVKEATTLGDERPGLNNLRWIVPTGDALSPELCRQWLRLYPTIPMLNNCGSTECSDDNCHYTIYEPPEEDYVLPIMPIGWPIHNIDAHILDEQLRPVPEGEAGELYIGGIGVGRGYVNNAERTAEVFLPDPFSREPGKRLYKTRDRARYLPDGSIQFLGRSDNLIKIRGLRIEPNEIEGMLERHPAIQESVVLAWESGDGSRHLVAYIVLAREESASNEELRDWLRMKLPEYMIPAIYVRLDAVPLNANGKLDRQALPAPDLPHSELQALNNRPRTRLEETIAATWSEVLEIERVGIHDNFFALGGDSLLAMRVISRLRAIFSTEVPIHSFLEDPTVAQLAQLFQESQAASMQANKPPLKSIAREAYRVPTLSVLGQNGQSAKGFQHEKGKNNHHRH
jgi:amino acid adenylation domain-containing protein